MSEIDKMARQMLAASVRRGSDTQATYVEYGKAAVVEACDAEHAIRTALLTAPPGWRLVPIPPTDEMIEAAQDAHMPFGDMHFAITSAILAAPEPKA